MSKLSKTAVFYRKNKRSRDKKKAYDVKYESSPERVAYRVRLNRERRRRHLKHDPRDLSHNKDGSLTLESKHLNRKRNGSNGRSTLK